MIGLDEKFKEIFIDSVKKTVENDLLNEDEYEAILGICRKATERGVANLTELYMINAIGGGAGDVQSEEAEAEGED